MRLAFPLFLEFIIAQSQAKLHRLGERAHIGDYGELIFLIIAIEHGPGKRGRAGSLKDSGTQGAGLTRETFKAYNALFMPIDPFLS